MTLAQSQARLPNDIETLAFDFDVADHASAIASPDRMLVAIRQELLATIDQCIDFAALGAEHVQIPSIALDLGDFDDPPDWDVVRQKLQDDLLGALAPHLKHPIPFNDTAARVDPAHATMQTITAKILRVRLTGQPDPKPEALQAAIADLSRQDLKALAQRLNAAGFVFDLPDEPAAQRRTLFQQIKSPGESPEAPQPDAAQIRLTLTGEQNPTHATVLAVLRGLSEPEFAAVIAQLGIQDQVAGVARGSRISAVAEALHPDKTSIEKPTHLMDAQNTRIRDILAQSHFADVGASQHARTALDAAENNAESDIFQHLFSMLISASEVDTLLQKNLPANATQLRNAIAKLTNAAHPDAARRAALAALLQRLPVDIAAIREASPAAHHTPALTLARLLVAMGDTPRVAAQRIADLHLKNDVQGATHATDDRGYNPDGAKVDQINASQGDQQPQRTNQPHHPSGPQSVTDKETDTVPFASVRAAQKTGATPSAGDVSTAHSVTNRPRHIQDERQDIGDHTGPAQDNTQRAQSNQQTDDTTNARSSKDGAADIETQAAQTTDGKSTNLGQTPSSAAQPEELKASRESVGQDITESAAPADHHKGALGTDQPDATYGPGQSEPASDMNANRNGQAATDPSGTHPDSAQKTPNDNGDIASHTDTDPEAGNEGTQTDASKPAPQDGPAAKATTDAQDEFQVVSADKETRNTPVNTLAIPASARSSAKAGSKQQPVHPSDQTAPDEAEKQARIQTPADHPPAKSTANAATADSQSPDHRHKDQTDGATPGRSQQSNDPAQQPPTQPTVEGAAPAASQKFSGAEQAQSTVAETEALFDGLLEDMLPTAQTDIKATLRMLAAVITGDTTSQGADKTTFWAAALHAASTVASDGSAAANTLTTTFANNLLATRQDRTLSLRNAIARLTYKATGSDAAQRQAKSMLEAMLTPAETPTPVQPTPDATPRYDTQMAGLILFHPYIAMLFERLEIGRDRKGILPEALGTARSALDHLAFGDDLPDLPADTLQKCLLGLPADAPSPERVLLDQTSTDLIDSLIQSVISQWGKLGNTSADGLRAAFVQRGGILQFESAERHVLTVNTGPYDMLLDALPWSINMVSLPWMPAPLMVDWRDRDD